MARILAVITAFGMLVCTAEATLTTSQPGVISIDIGLMAAQMKYWVCSEDGETADILLHVMAESTVQSTNKNSKAVGCSVYPRTVAAVDAAAAAYSWIPPTAGSWTGCKDTTCTNPVSTATYWHGGPYSPAPLQLSMFVYVRLLEFGHEQADSCAIDANAAIDLFLKNLVARGCTTKVCWIPDYIAARPKAPDCPPLLK